MKNLLSIHSDNEDEFAFEDFIGEIPNYFNGFYRIEGRNMGWRNRSGTIERKRITSWQELSSVLPRTDDMSIEIFGKRRGRNKVLEMTVYHHDSPTGEYYTFTKVGRA